MCPAYMPAGVSVQWPNQICHNIDSKYMLANLLPFGLDIHTETGLTTVFLGHPATCLWKGFQQVVQYPYHTNESEQKKSLTDSKAVGQVVKSISYDNHPRDRRDWAGNIVAVIMSAVAVMSERVLLRLHVTVLMHFVVRIVGKLAHVCIVQQFTTCVTCTRKNCQPNEQLVRFCFFFAKSAIAN